MQRRSPKSQVVDNNDSPTLVPSFGPPPKTHVPRQQQRLFALLCIGAQLFAQGFIATAATLSVVGPCYWYWCLLPPPAVLPPPLPADRGHSQLATTATSSRFGLVKVPLQSSSPSSTKNDAPDGQFRGTANGNPVAMNQQVDDISTNAQYLQFFDAHCDFGNDPVALWPDGDDAWQRRAPHFLILGAKKAGTTSYWAKLVQHPYITVGAGKEMHSFQSNALGQWIYPSQIGTKIKMDEARRTLFNVSTSMHPVSALQQHAHLISLDATPDYLLLSDISPHVVLCTAPWVKLLVTLRDPVERLFSNYNFMRQHAPAFGNVTFEEWVEQDMETLRKAGVIDHSYRDVDDNEERTKRRSSRRPKKDEHVYWKQYQRLNPSITPERQVARSLYVLQLEAWLRWLRAAGRDPAATLRVVWQDDLRRTPNGTLNDISHWLGLPDHPFDTNPKDDMMITNYTTTLAPLTRSRLRDFFAPYNDRLVDLLRREKISFAPR